MTRALVSIGTNSTRLLAERDGIVVAQESRGTRLGAGVRDDDPLDPEAVQRTLDAIDAYVARIRPFAPAIDAISTSVLRRARDGDRFAAEVERRTGARPRVLDGDEEATYSFLGATERAPAGVEVGVLDVGGGSAELAIDDPSRARERGDVARTQSVEIGAVRLAERHPAILGERALGIGERAALLAAARADAAAVLAPYARFAPCPSLIAVGGTVFTAAAMVAGAATYDGVRIERPEIAALLDTLLARDLEARRALAFIRPQRADILPAGLVIVDEACRMLGASGVTVSERDLLAGYLNSPAFRGHRLP